MNNSTKDQIGCDVICKSHSARTERDLYRICPSKLSKRELEDLYFALLENNLELKKTINVQQDKIKVLSTRLQRMTVVQKNGAGKEKDCCASKAVVSEQKESLTDLKKTNERMAERIRLLNMRLCSAKQFLKRSSLQSNTSNKICTRCSFKNSSMSALNAKRSDSNIRTTAVSCQSLDNNIIEKPTRTVETETEIPEKENLEPCNENKCRTMMDELKEKIVNLQEELAISHNEYSERMAKLESQVSQLNYENVRARSECVASEHALQERVKKADLLQDKLRNADAKCNELNMELSIEKRKVTELETGLKLANMSKHVLDTIDQFTAEKNDDDDDDKQEQAMSELCRNRSCCSEVSQKERVCSPTESAIGLVVATPSAEPKAAQLELPSTSIGDEIKISVSEDSGYTELNKSCETEADQAMVKMNRELLQKIADLQTQLDMLRISTAGETKSKQSKKPSNSESYDVEIKDINEKQPLNVDEPSTMVNLIIEERNSDAPQAELEGDKDTSPENEERPSTSEPWEDYLIAGGNANVDHSDSDNMEQPVESSTVKHKSEMRVIRDDEHNSFQIPGPMPVASSAQSFSKDKKKSFKNSLTSKDSYNERLRKKKANSEEKTVKIFEDSQDSYFNSEKQNGSATKVGKPMDPTLVANLKEYVRDMEAERRTKDMAEKKQKSVSITDVEAKLADRTPTRDSIFVNRRKLASNSDNETMAEVKKESMTSFYLDSVCTPPQASAKSLQRRELAQDEENVKNVDNFGTEMDPPPIPNRRDSATYTADAANTYTVEVEKRSRATSPENTEHEISSLTDLPSEKDAKSPRAVLSPGEEKATMTYTDTETETMPADYGSLSEGEMPGGRKDRKLSFGETPAALARISIPATTSSERMQATLQSISEELARCRQLLLNQRPEEVTTYSTLS